jgi:hypothetical protein
MSRPRKIVGRNGAPIKAGGSGGSARPASVSASLSASGSGARALRKRERAKKRSSDRAGLGRDDLDARTDRLVSWFAELAMLTEEHGGATARLWHEIVHAERDPATGESGPRLSRHDSDKHFERVGKKLVEYGVPHERVSARKIDPEGSDSPSAIAIRILCSRADVEKYTVMLRRCARKQCRRWFPADEKHFYRRSGAAENLDDWCKKCRRAGR